MAERAKSSLSFTSGLDMTKSKISANKQKVPERSPRGRPREFDRTEALNSAMELFWKNGYMQTSLGELCQVMGITAPSFYCAFKTREDLFLETLEHYMRQYWDRTFEEFMAEKNIFRAFELFFTAAVKIYMRPGLSKGCFIDVSTVGLSSKEVRIINALASMTECTRKLFHGRFMSAIEVGQIPAESDIPAITGAVMAFLKGIAAMARENFCQTELLEIAKRGLFLLPPVLNK